IPNSPMNVEEEADRFAAEFLMPEDAIKNSLRNLTFPKLGELKRYWKVSMKALVYRAKTLGTINEREYRNFHINFSKQKMTKSEPITLPEEKPFTVNEIVRLHLQELSYEKNELAKVIHLNEKEFEDRFIYSDRPKLKVLRTL